MGVAIIALILDRLMGVKIQTNSPAEMNVLYHYLLWLGVGAIWNDVLHHYLKPSKE
jgi:hypothetical protein